MRRRDGDEDEGFSLIEVAIAGAIFMMVSLGFLTMMMASIQTYDSARDRTLSQQIATQQLEQARRLPWDQIGVAGGNPPGAIQPTQQPVVGGLTFKVVTTVTFVDDPVPSGISTGANYKRVTVTVTSTGAGSKPYASETLIAPPTQPSLNTGVIKVYVRDFFMPADELSGANVQILTGPSATRADTTDAHGNVIFASLTPTALTGPQAFYDVVSSLAGYTTWPQDVVPAPIVHFALDPGSAPTATIRMYKPATINVDVRDYLGNPTGRAGTAVLTSANGRGTATLPLTAGKATFTQTTTAAPASVSTALIWNENYSVKVTMSDGTVLNSTAAAAAPSYTSLTSTVTLQLPTPPMGTLKVLVRSTGLGTPPVPAGTVVTATGGPEVATLTAATDATGTATFASLPGSATVGYTISIPAVAPYGAGSKSVTVPANATTNANLDVTGPPASTTLLVRLRSAGLGNPVIGSQAVTLTGGPTNVNLTAVTDAITGIATFTVPASNAAPLYTASVVAAAPYGAGSASSVALPADASPVVDLTVTGPAADTTLQVRLRSTGSGNPVIAGAPITLTGGPTNVNQTATTNAGGIATFTVPATSTVPYTASVAASGAYGAGSVISLAAPNQTTTASLDVSGP